MTAGRLHLKHIQKAIWRIEDCTAGSLELFVDTLNLLSACIRQSEIGCEATMRLSHGGLSVLKAKSHPWLRLDLKADRRCK